MGFQQQMLPSEAPEEDRGAGPILKHILTHKTSLARERSVDVVWVDEFRFDPKVGSKRVDNESMNDAESQAKKAVRDYKQGLIEERGRIQERLVEIAAELKRIDAFLLEPPVEAVGPASPGDEAETVAIIDLVRGSERGLTMGEMYEAALSAGVSLAGGEHGRKGVSEAVKRLVASKRLYRTAGGRYKPRKRPIRTG